jgi:hypothetical protein
MPQESNMKQAMTPIRIKIGHQNQANEPIYLYPNGKIVCGNYEYSGKYKQRFREVYALISDLVDQSHPDDSIDVSTFRFWNAAEVYDEYIAKKWKKSIGAKTLERLAIETRIFLELEEVRSEFKRAVSAKWKKIFRNSDISDPTTPTQGWHLFRNPRCE